VPSMEIAGTLLVCVVVQVFVLLEIGRRLVARAWSAHLDPDSHVVPYLTGLSDLLGVVVVCLVLPNVPGSSFA
jgi:cation transporter-like permease